MKKSDWTQKVYSYLRNAQQWYLDTPERSLDEAYKAALLIKAIEDEHFNGQKIAPQSANYNGSVLAYFQSELKKHLKTIRMRLVEFNASRSIFGSSNQTITKLSRTDGTTVTKDSFAIQPRNNPSLILEKLRFIDEVVAKYRGDISITAKQPEILNVEPRQSLVNITEPPQAPINNIEPKPRSKAEETNVLPRSIINTLNRLQVELDPNAEQEVVKKFRASQRKTLISVRLVLLLIIIPFLTFQKPPSIATLSSFSQTVPFIFAIFLYSFFYFIS